MKNCALCSTWSIYVLFGVFSYLFTVSLVSTTVLNTFDTLIKLLLLLLPINRILLLIIANDSEFYLLFTAE